MRAATDADYNLPGGEVRMKIEIYFDGRNRPPLVVSGENYLIDAEILEEAGADSPWPIGEVSANELSFSLHNDNGQFNPMNKSGPYYGKIATGVVIKPYIRPGAIDDEIEWSQMGEFRVTNWTATVTGIEAAVTAQDAIRDINSAEKIKLPVVKDVTMKEHYERTLDYAGVAHDVSDLYGTKNLPYSFMSPTNSETLRDSTIAARGLCMSDRVGKVIVKPIMASGPLRATLTDGDQIVHADSDQSILSDYKGAAVYFSSPQLKYNAPLLSMSGFKVLPGEQVHDKITFTAPAVMTLSSLAIVSDEHVKITAFEATSDDIKITTWSDHDSEIEVVLEIKGIALEHIEQMIRDEGLDGTLLEVKNNYIQTGTDAKDFKSALAAYVDGGVPELRLDIKGNPLIQVGDKVRAVSERHSLDFTGIVKRTTMRYAGGLSGQLVLLNTAMFGGA